MGNFQQHLNWAYASLVTILTIIIILLVEFSGEVYEFFGQDSLDIYSIILVPILFLIGAIAPDIDLPRESRETSFIAKRLAPVVGGLTIGFGAMKGIEYTLTDPNSPYYNLLDREFLEELPFGWIISVGILSGIIGLLIVYGAITITDKKAVHWGKLHSIGAAWLFSLPILFGGAVWFGSTPEHKIFAGGVMSTAFLAGYICHLTCDQIYHEIRRKHWRSPRYALKLWSNHWRFDPFIMLAELISPELKQKKK